ncbi:MAG: hypothetical protein WCO33_01990 [bacterium]
MKSQLELNSKDSKPNIQRDIIAKLSLTGNLRYSELQNKDISSDLFNYHLKFLLSKGLIKKEGLKYSLSDLGRRLVADNFNINLKGYVTENFRVCVLTAIFKKDENGFRIINQKRLVQPFIGNKGILGSQIHKTEGIFEAASRTALIETNLVVDPTKWKYLGMFRSITYIKDDYFHDIFYNLVVTDDYEGEVQNTVYGENYFVNLDTAIKDEKSSFTPFDAIVKYYEDVQKKNNIFQKIDFKEQTYHLDSF